MECEEIIMEIKIGNSTLNISLGIIVFGLSMLVTAIGAYLTLQNNISNMQKDISRIEAQIQESQDASGVTGLIEVRGNLDTIGVTLEYLEKQLDQLDASIR